MNSRSSAIVGWIAFVFRRLGGYLMLLEMAFCPGTLLL